MSHLVPFAGRKYSGSVQQNLLWQDRNVYLMDNHRAAMWCWQQHIDLRKEQHSILHIDRHYDTLKANLDAHMAEMPDLDSMGISEYLEAEVTALGFKFFRWDNYLSLHVESFGPQLDCLLCLTHQEGDKPEHASLFELSHFAAPENLETWMEGARWIVNIDLDYFFCDGSSDRPIRAVSDEFIFDLFTTLRRLNDSGRIAVLTLCLTPTDFTPGWEECLSMSRSIFDILGAAHPKI